MNANSIVDPIRGLLQGEDAEKHERDQAQERERDLAAQVDQLSRAVAELQKDNAALRLSTLDRACTRIPWRGRG